MTQRIIAHALFNWADADGVLQMATHGQTVDLPAALISKYEPLGVFEPELEPEPETELAAAQQDSDKIVTTEAESLVVPEWVSPKATWAQYATQLGIDTDELTKDQIIAAVNELAQKQETEHA